LRTQLRTAHESIFSALFALCIQPVVPNQIAATALEKEER
jgi:hypothetical protein